MCCARATLGDARARRPGACRLSTRCTQHAGRASITSERRTPRWTAPKSAFGLLRLFAAVRHLACAAARRPERHVPHRLGEPAGSRLLVLGRRLRPRRRGPEPRGAHQDR
eukprot:5434301-Prymnesium_polylepis.1